VRSVQPGSGNPEFKLPFLSWIQFSRTGTGGAWR
jgi:hypothetical protein